MNELDKQLVYVVDRDNGPAWDAVMRIVESHPKPGQLIPLSGEEFKALKSGVMVLQLPDRVSDREAP